MQPQSKAAPAHKDRQMIRHINSCTEEHAVLKLSLSFSGRIPGHCSNPVVCLLCLRLLLPQPEHRD